MSVTAAQATAELQALAARRQALQQAYSTGKITFAEWQAAQTSLNSAEGSWTARLNAANNAVITNQATYAAANAATTAALSAQLANDQSLFAKGLTTANTPLETQSYTPPASVTTTEAAATAAQAAAPAVAAKAVASGVGTVSSAALAATTVAGSQPAQTSHQITTSGNAGTTPAHVTSTLAVRSSVVHSGLPPKGWSQPTSVASSRVETTVGWASWWANLRSGFQSPLTLPKLSVTLPHAPGPYPLRYRFLRSGTAGAVSRAILARTPSESGASLMIPPESPRNTYVSRGSLEPELSGAA